MLELRVTLSGREISVPEKFAEGYLEGAWVASSGSAWLASTLGCLLPSEVVLDENNKTVLAYYAHLMAKKSTEQVLAHRPPLEHTHNRLDRKFGTAA